VRQRTYASVTVRMSMARCDCATTGKCPNDCSGHGRCVAISDLSAETRVQPVGPAISSYGGDEVSPMMPTGNELQQYLWSYDSGSLVVVVVVVALHVEQGQLRYTPVFKLNAAIVVAHHRRVNSDAISGAQ
jgi:hypothetical protein